jgi:hypothetical protein
MTTLGQNFEDIVDPTGRKIFGKNFDRSGTMLSPVEEPPPAP